MSAPRIYTLKRHWREQLSFRLATGFLLLYLLCALGADVLPLGFKPNQLDLAHLYQLPFYWPQYTPGQPFHWLGTDGLGRDVLANIVYGCRTSFLISLPVMVAATAIGIGLGSLAGFCGNRFFRMTYVSLVLYSFAVVLAWFYGFYARSLFLGLTQPSAEASSAGQRLVSLSIMIGIFAGAAGLRHVLVRLLGLRQSFYFPVDLLVLKLIEVITAIPRLILILCLAAFVYPSLQTLMLLTLVSYWAGPARLVRGELRKVSALPYVQAAGALGLPTARILFRHALPNSLTSVAVAFTFGVTSLLALESTLSFLGIGVPPDLPSWGRMIAGIKSNLSAWWLVLLPGITLSLAVLSIQTCSQYLQKAFLSVGE